MATPFLRLRRDKDWCRLRKTLLSYQHYNIPSLSAFSTARAGLVYNHDEQTLSCPDCGLLLRDLATHFDVFALHSACDSANKCSFLKQCKGKPENLSGWFAAKYCTINSKTSLLYFL